MIQRLLIPSYLSTICWDGPWVSGEEVRATALMGLSAQLDDQVSAVKIEENTEAVLFVNIQKVCCGAAGWVKAGPDRGEPPRSSGEWREN